MLWDWYARNGIPTEKHYFLRSIRGLALYRFSKSGSRLDANASARLSLGLPFFSTKFRGSGQISEADDFVLENFRIARLQKAGAPDTYYSPFDPIPTFEQVTKVIARSGATLVTRSLGDGEDDVARPGSVKAIQVEIEALPSRYCSRLMKIIPDAATELSIGRPFEAKNAAGNPICVFPLSYSVPATGGEDLDFFLAYDPVATLPGITPFQIPVSFSFSASETPTVANLAVKEEITTVALDGGVSRLSWSVAGEIRDEGFIESADQLDLTTVEQVAVQPKIDSPTAVSFNITGEFLNLQKGWEQRAITCRVGGEMGLNTAAGEVTRLIGSFYIRVPLDEDTLPQVEPDPESAEETEA